LPQPNDFWPAPDFEEGIFRHTTCIDEAAAGSAGSLPAGLWSRFPIRRQDAGAPGYYQRNL